MSEVHPKRTALYTSHLKHGGKMIEFAGWELAVSYEGLAQEHEAVRTHAGIFDVSHMGELLVSGKSAQAFVSHLVTNEIASLAENQIAYTLMCYENGGVVDDILVYKYHPERFLLVVNASNIEKDLEWILAQKAAFDVEVENRSDALSQIAIQGPNAETILQGITNMDLSTMKFFFFRDNVSVSNVPCLVSRSGYTGEDGFEIYVPNEHAPALFEKLLEIGKPFGLKPCGLGSRDTLRFEATLPLYGNEISADISPIEAGLGMFVKFSKESFIGKESLQKQKTDGPSRKTVGFEMLDKGIPRHGYDVLSSGSKIGTVTTGYLSPTLKKNIGLALIDASYAELGTNIDIQIRNKAYRAIVINKHFLQKNYKK